MSKLRTEKQRKVLTTDDIRTIRALRKSLPATEIARLYDRTTQSIYMICGGAAYNFVPDDPRSQWEPYARWRLDSWPNNHDPSKRMSLKRVNDPFPVELIPVNRIN